MGCCCKKSKGDQEIENKYAETQPLRRIPEIGSKIKEEKASISTEGNTFKSDEEMAKIMADGYARKFDEEMAKLLREGVVSKYEEERARSIAEEYARKIGEDYAHKIREENAKRIVIENQAKLDEAKADRIDAELRGENAKMIAIEKQIKLDEAKANRIGAENQAKLREDNKRIIAENQAKLTKEKPIIITNNNVKNDANDKRKHTTPDQPAPRNITTDMLASVSVHIDNITDSTINKKPISSVCYRHNHNHLVVFHISSNHCMLTDVSTLSVKSLIDISTDSNACTIC